MDGRPTLTDYDEVGDYVVPNVLSPRDLVWTKLYHTLNNFSVMLERSHRFLGITSTFGE